MPVVPSVLSLLVKGELKGSELTLNQILFVGLQTVDPLFTPALLLLLQLLEKHM